MAAPARPFLAGLGLAIGIALPATVVANVIAELGDLPRSLSSVLVLVVLAGMVIGGGVVGQADPPRAPLQAALVGLVGIMLIATLGYIRRTISGEDVSPLVIPMLGVVGSLFGAIGGAVGQSRTARTRR